MSAHFFVFILIFIPVNCISIIAIIRIHQDITASIIIALIKTYPTCRYRRSQKAKVWQIKLIRMTSKSTVV